MFLKYYVNTYSNFHRNQGCRSLSSNVTRNIYSVHSRVGSSAYLRIASTLVILVIFDFHFWKRLNIALDVLSRSAPAVHNLWPFMCFMGNGFKSMLVLPKWSSFMHFCTVSLFFQRLCTIVLQNAMFITS